MRYASRLEARNREVLKSARIIEESANRVVYVQRDTLYVIRLVEIKPGCEDCQSMWGVSRELILPITTLLAHRGLEN